MCLRCVTSVVCCSCAVLGCWRSHAGLLSASCAPPSLALLRYTSCENILQIRSCFFLLRSSLVWDWTALTSLSLPRCVPLSVALCVYVCVSLSCSVTLFLFLPLLLSLSLFPSLSLSQFNSNALYWTALYSIAKTSAVTWAVNKNNGYITHKQNKNKWIILIHTIQTFV